LASNNIDNINEFHKLKGLENLTHLVLMDEKKSTCNPFCIKNKNYKFEIQKILPKLDSIDGELFKDSKSIMKNFDDILAQIKEKSSLNEESVFNNENDSESEAWVSKNSIKLESSDKTIKDLFDIRIEREKFKSNLSLFLI
jgi:hypothetical protein